MAGGQSQMGIGARVRKAKIAGVFEEITTPTTTTTTTPTPAKTYKVPGYGGMTKDEIKKKYDKLR